MKVTGSLWKGWEWEKAINEHIKTGDCYFEEVFEDVNKEYLIRESEFCFKYYRLLGYGNRFKRYTTKIPLKYYPILEDLKTKFPGKFIKVNEYGQKIKEEFIQEVLK